MWNPIGPVVDWASDGGADQKKGSTVSGYGSNGSGTAEDYWRGQAASGQPSPYSSGPGVQPGKTQTQFEGLDFTQRGPAETNWISNQGAYNSPSFGEVNAQGLVGTYSDPNNRPQLTNNSQNWLEQFRGAMPNLPENPGLAPYFDNAKTRAAESIDQAAAARGNYGSSSAIDQNARAFTDLEGQRALKEADYALQRAGEQRAWQGLGGQLAGSADASGRAISGNEQQWAQLLASLGIDASRLGLDRTNSGMDAANVAGSAERARGRDYFSDTAASGDRLADLMKSVYLPALDQDWDAFASANSGGVAQGNAGVANEQANAATASDALQTGFSLYNQYQKP